MAGTEAGTKRRRSVCGRKPRKGVGLYMPVNPACDVPLSRRSPRGTAARADARYTPSEDVQGCSVAEVR